MITQRKKIILTSVVALLAISGYVGFFITLYKTSLRLSAIQNEIKSEDDKEAGLKLVGKSLDETKTERGILKSLLISKDGAVSFIESIENLGNEAEVSVSIKSLDVQKIPYENLEKVEARIEARGQLDSVKKFFSLMLELPKGLEWSRVSVSQELDSESDSDTWLLSAEISALKIK